jgi:hypothetical protein
MGMVAMSVFHSIIVPWVGSSILVMSLNNVDLPDHDLQTIATFCPDWIVREKSSSNKSPVPPS